MPIAWMISMLSIVLLVAVAAAEPAANPAPSPRTNDAPAPSATPIEATPAPLEDEPAPSSSMMSRAKPRPMIDANGRVEPRHELRQRSMFAVAAPEPRVYKIHDLVQIVIRETSKATSSQETEAKKKYNLDAKIPDWPDFQLADLLQFQLLAGASVPDPKVKVEANKNFKGEGDYERKDDLTARLTAEVIEVLPNGNLILEARTFIKTDKEQATMKVTGICRPEDVTAANTIQSQQVHDLKIEKMHEGELKDASKKGIIAKVLDTIFSF
jgi:flagellar L-ring protein FlgH